MSHLILNLLPLLALELFLKYIQRPNVSKSKILEKKSRF